MDKLHLFETAEEHYNTYLGSGYTEPWVGYDNESNDTTYNYGVLEENSKLYASMYRFIQEYYTNYNDNGEMMETFKRFKTLMKTNAYKNFSVFLGNTTSSGAFLATLYADTDCINGEKIALSFVSNVPNEMGNENNDVIINYMLTEANLQPVEIIKTYCETSPSIE